MKKEKYLYSTGEFAKLNGINKRTLHYYNDIGLFSPEVQGENGYHYYTCFQTISLELILVLRKIGFSIEEIKRYTNAPSDFSFTQLVEERKKLIDQSIKQLLEAKKFLQQKSDKLALGLTAEHKKVELIRLPEQRILLSKPITGQYDKEDFSIAADFSFRLKMLFGLYDNFGSRILVDNIMQGDFESYDSFFAYGQEGVPYDMMRPSGTYLRTFCIGGWDKLREVYDNALSFAAKNGITLSGYAYEEGLNEISLQHREDYITMVTIAYKKSV